MKNEYTINLVEIINQAGMEFSSQDARGVTEIYSRAGSRTKGTINNIFVALTGYELPTLLKMARAKRYSELDDDAQKVAQKNYREGLDETTFTVEELNEIDLHERCSDINDEILYMENGQDFDSVQHDIIEVLSYHSNTEEG